MAKRLPALTARDKTSVRKTARELRAAYDRGEEDSLSETVVISSGYADVEIYPDDEGTAYVVRHGVTTSVPMSARRKTRKRKVLHWSEYQSNHVPMTDAEFNRQADVYYAKTGVRLHRNPSRKRVPSKRVNPAMHLPPRPSDRASHVAWDSYMEKVDAMPVSFAGQPAYVRDLWNLTAMGFGNVSSDGTVVEFARKYHDDVWRKHPALKGKSVARIRLHEDGMVTPMRSVKVSNPARKRAPKGR